MSDFATPMMIPFRPPPGLSLPGEEEGLPCLQTSSFTDGIWNSTLFHQFPGADHETPTDNLWAAAAATKASAAAAAAKAAGFTAEETSEQVPEEVCQVDPVSENKEVRKLEKKLRDISKLEAKVATGERVDPLQLKKIEKKDAIEEELNALKEQLMKEILQTETQMDAKVPPPPGFDVLSAGKCGFSPINKLRPGAAVCEDDDATTLPGSTASDQGGDSDSESQISEVFRSPKRLSASAPVFVPQTHSAFFMPMGFAHSNHNLSAMEPMMSATRTPLKNTAALFMPNTGLRQDAPAFIPSAIPPAESFIPEAKKSCVPEAKEEEEKVTWRSTWNRKEEEHTQGVTRTKLTSGSAEIFVPQFPDLKASMEMKTKGNVKAKKTTPI